MSRRRSAAMLRLVAALLLVLTPWRPAAAQRGPLVLAAASLQESLNAAADAWAGAGHPRPRLSFAASSALARQIQAGAPADLFLSADEAWMDVVARDGLIAPGSRATLLGNRLVLIAPADSRLTLRIGRGMPLARALGRGRLAVADPRAVPAGRYAQAALTALGVWSGVANRLARADDVRGALALVERGEAPLGIVYATDALASKRVRTLSAFPPGSHPPIAYPIARLRTARDRDAEPFRRFLLSPAAKRIFARFGFATR